MSHWLIEQISANRATFIFVGFIFTMLGMGVGVLIGKAHQKKFDKWFYKLVPNAKRPWGI